MDFMDTNHAALPFPQQRQPRSADPVPREHIGQLIAALQMAQRIALSSEPAGLKPACTPSSPT